MLVFISMINTTSEILKARNFFICRYCSFYEQLKFVLSELSTKKVPKFRGQECKSAVSESSEGPVKYSQYATKQMKQLHRNYLFMAGNFCEVCIC